MGLVIDTSALIAWERAGESIDLSNLPADEELILPSVVWAEALVGVRLADTPDRAARRRARLEAIRSATDVEPFSPQIAEHYADIFAELHRQGNLIPQNDMAVAATARAFKSDVLVGPHDEAHFRRVSGISVTVVS